MSDERDKKTSGLMGIVLEEIAAHAGQSTGPVLVEITHRGEQVYLSATGWPLLESHAPEPPDDAAIRVALERLGAWAREGADPLVDACMNTPLAQRENLVECVLERVVALGPDARKDASALLRFLDDGLALDGDAARLSIRIQTALLEELADG